MVTEDTNGTGDVFLHDLETGLTKRVTVSTGGAQGNGFSDAPSISSDGRFVAFESSASNLVPGDNNNNTDVFVRDRLEGSTEGAWLNPAGIGESAGRNTGNQRRRTLRSLRRPPAGLGIGI